jgi:hypothetical protein
MSPGPFADHLEGNFMLAALFRALDGNRQPTVRLRSDKTIGSLPLYEVAFGPRWSHGEQHGHARAVIAIGDQATGVVAVGGLAQGMLAIGGLSEGVIAVGGCTLGLLLAFGGVAVGGIALGGVAIGAATRGGVSIGLTASGKTAVSVED